LGDSVAPPRSPGPWARPLHGSPTLSDGRGRPLPRQGSRERERAPAAEEDRWQAAADDGGQNISPQAQGRSVPGGRGSPEYCRLRASRGHLFEHFCRERFRQHALLIGNVAHEIHVELADFALRLDDEVTTDVFFPPCFVQLDSVDTPLLLQTGTVVFEIKQNPEAAYHALEQLAERASRVTEASAAVLLTSCSGGGGTLLASERLSELREQFRTLSPNLPLFWAYADFNESAWAERLVATVESAESRLPEREAVLPSVDLLRLPCGRERGSTSANRRRRSHAPARHRRPLSVDEEFTGQRPLSMPLRRPSVASPRRAAAARELQPGGAARGGSTGRGRRSGRRNNIQVSQMRIGAESCGVTPVGVPRGYSRARRAQPRWVVRKRPSSMPSGAMQDENARPPAVATETQLSGQGQERLVEQQQQQQQQLCQQLVQGQQACPQLACPRFHWPDLGTGLACQQCSFVNCDRCHCGSHLRPLLDATRGSAARVSASLRVWLLACVDSNEGLALVATAAADGSLSEINANWHVPLRAPEVQLLQPTVYSSGLACDIVARPAEGAFYLCHRKNRVPRRRRMPSASVEPRENIASL